MPGKMFSPIKIGQVEIKNRIAMAPMSIRSLADEKGGFSRRAQEYYVARARGGTGLIVTGIARIENEIEKHQPRGRLYTMVDPFNFISTAAEMNKRVHAYGAKIFLQLALGYGRSADPKWMADRPVAPSAIPCYWDPTVTCRELTTMEVETLVEKTIQSAAIARAAGFDGVEIHAVHEGYLLDQFTMAFFNRRTDKYGGDLRGRLTFPIEIVKGIKNKLGTDYPVLLRYSIKSYIKDWGQGGLPGEEFEEKGRDLEEGLAAAQILEEAGYDGFNADAGSYDAWYWAHPPVYQKHGLYLHLTDKLKEVVSVPVIVAGRMEVPDLAFTVINEGRAADMVALGRGLLADPDWGNKVAGGNFEDVRPCLGCHDGCLGGITPLSCAVNPACGREVEYNLWPAQRSKNVMIIGGGVAGMEAARVASIRGHKVSLYEKSGELGGHVIASSRHAFKDDNARLLQWYRTQLQKLNIEVHLHTEVNKELVEKIKPDAVIVATGSRPALPPIRGIDEDMVMTASDALLGSKEVDEKVVIMGGGLIGCETALELARQGKKVTIVEILPELMAAGLPVPHANRVMLLDLLSYYKVNILTGTSLLQIRENSVELINASFARDSLHAGTVIVATGLQADRELYQSLRDSTSVMAPIGDAAKPRNIMHAVWEAYEVARTL